MELLLTFLLHSLGYHKCHAAESQTSAVSALGSGQLPLLSPEGTKSPSRLLAGLTQSFPDDEGLCTLSFHVLFRLQTDPLGGDQSSSPFAPCPITQNLLTLPCP